MPNSKNAKAVVIVGGGLAGLSTAAILSAAGQRVTLLEQNSWIGGKSRRIEIAGQRIDTGPSLVTFPEILKRVLDRVEKLSGSELSAFRELSFRVLPEVGKYFLRDSVTELPVPESHRWHSAWQRYFEKRSKDERHIATLLTESALSLRAAAAAATLTRNWNFKLSGASYLESLKWMPRELREIIAIHSLNAGLSPEQTLTIFTSLPAIMALQGVRVPVGGVYEIPLMLGKISQELGAELLLETKVHRITPATEVGGRAKVSTNNGDFEADWVVLAADAPGLDTRGHESAGELKLTCSGVAIFGVLKDGHGWDVCNHSVVLPDDSAELFSDLKKGVWPRQTMSFVNYYPAGEIYPNNRNVAAILLTAPANGKDVSVNHPFVKEELARIGHKLQLNKPILDFFEDYLILDPGYFDSWGNHRGALYGRARGLLQSGPFHHPRHFESGWLWRVGSAVHPGGGIPAVLGGVLIVTRKMLKRLGVRISQ